MASASDTIAKLNLIPHLKADSTLQPTETLLLLCLRLSSLPNQPQYTVSPNVWFGAFPTKDLSISANGRLIKAGERDGERHYSLVGHTCAPASEFQDLELAKRSDLVSRFPNSELLISKLSD